MLTTRPLLTTKLYIPPPRPDRVPRPHLVARLKAGLACPLTVVAAPAGFGKTTLISEWIHDFGFLILDFGLGANPANPKSKIKNPQFAWFSLDEADNDPIGFWSYVVAALQTVNAALGKNVLSLLQSTQPPLMNVLLAMLINDLRTNDAEIILVLDDYHLITSEPVHQAVAYWVDHAPHNVHLVILSRTTPPLPLARWRLDRRVSEIGMDDLRLTQAEIALLLNEQMHLNLPEAAIATLAARTEGWLAGLLLAVLALQQRRSTQRDEANSQLLAMSDQFGGNHEHIFAYFAEEVLRQQPGAIRDFLLQTAVLDRFCAPLCVAITGNSDSQALLAELIRLKLFLIPLDARQNWFRYHHLFADFLRTQVGHPTRITLHRRASEWYQTHGFLAEAVQHALATDDLAHTQQVMAQAVAAALPGGEFVTALGWLNRLPETVVRTNPDLAVYKGWLLLFQGEVATAEAYADAASQCMLPDTPLVSRGRLTGLRAAIASDREAVTIAIELAYEALEQLAEADPFFRGTILMMLAEVQRALGAFEAALETHRQVFQRNHQLQHPGVALVAAGNLAHLLYRQGQRQAAVALCQEVLEHYLGADGQPLPVAGGVYLLLGLMQLVAYRLDEARTLLEHSLQLSEEARLNDAVISAHCQLALLAQATSDTAQARTHSEQARQRAVQPYARAAVEAVAAGLELANGNLAAAERWARGVDFSWTGALHEGRRSSYLTYIRLLLAQGRCEAAQTLLHRLAESAQTQGQFGQLISIAVLQASAHQCLGHESQALADLQQAIRLAAPEQYRYVFITASPAIHALLPKVRPMAPAFVDSLLSCIQPQPDQPLIEPLSAREIEVLRLLAAGLSNQEIAATLVLTLGTTKWYVHQILAKLDVRSRTQAVARARALNLLSAG